MAHIIKFKIEGLAGSSSTLTRSLDRHVNVFYGENGSGKTTLLKVLHAALSLETASLVGAPFDRIEVTLHSVTAGIDFTLTTTRADVEREGGDARYSHPDPRIRRRRIAGAKSGQFGAWKYDGEVHPKIGRALQHEFLTIHRIYDHNEAIIAPEELDPEHSHTVLELQYEEYLQHLWNACYSSVQEEIQKIHRRGLGDILTALISPTSSQSRGTSPDSTGAYQRLQRFFSTGGDYHDNPFKIISQAQFLKSLQEHPNIHAVVDVVDQLENEITRVSAPTTLLQQFVSSMIRGPKRLEFTARGVQIRVGEAVLRARTLSSGEKHLMLILISAIRADVSSFLIDEPEMSLHLKWQRRVLPMLRELNPQCQIIAATHSPEILADVPRERVFEI